MKRTAQELGKVDVLFTNAGTLRILPFEQVTEEIYDDYISINQKGFYFTLQKSLPILNDNAAAIAMSRSLANELAAKDIRVNTVSPGAIIDTPGALKTISTALGVNSVSSEQIEAFSQNMLPGIPLKRFVKAAEVAKLCCSWLRTKLVI